MKKRWQYFMVGGVTERRLVTPGSCRWIMESGPRHGKRCKKATMVGLGNEPYNFCTPHETIIRRRDWGGK